VETLTSFFKNNGKYILLVFIPLVVIAIIFALPIKNVPIHTMETYYETQNIREPYTETETYTEEEPYTDIETSTQTVYDQNVNLTSWSHSFIVDKPDTTVSLNIQGYHYPYYSYYYVIPHDDDIYPFRFWPFDYIGGGQSQVSIEISYPEHVTKYRTVTKTREVTKYRDVPTRVEKERIVTTYERMSLWRYLFR
jgi:hypothetical protein